MRKLRKRDLYLVCAIFNITWFCIAVLWINYRRMDVSPELVIGWFAAWTSELLAIAKITTTKAETREPEEEE